MDEVGLWRLFFLTGLPEAYLAVKGEEGARQAAEYEPALTAFVARPSRKTES